MFLIVPAQAIVGQWLASFNLDEVMRKMSATQKN
jgi:hypothetical protein